MLAIVLARRDFREHDQLITLYTREQGKAEVIARGIKKITSKNSPFLEPFALLEAEIIPGKEKRYVGAVTVREAYLNIRGDLARALAGQSALALTNTLLVGEEPDERIFKLLVDFLKFLNAAPPAKNSLNRFSAELITYLGFAPSASVKTPAALLAHTRYHTNLPVPDWNRYWALVGQAQNT